MPTKIGIHQHDILHIHYPNDCCLCRSEQEVARLKDERIQSDKEWADKCIRLAMKIATLESSLKRAEGVSVEEIESCLWKQFPDLQTLTKPIAQAIHALLTTRKGE